MSDFAVPSGGRRSHLFTDRFLIKMLLYTLQYGEQVSETPENVESIWLARGKLHLQLQGLPLIGYSNDGTLPLLYAHAFNMKCVTQ